MVFGRWRGKDQENFESCGLENSVENFLNLQLAHQGGDCEAVMEASWEEVAIHLHLNHRSFLPWRDKSGFPGGESSLDHLKGAN